MVATIQSSDLRRRVREVLDRVRRDQEPVIVQTYGRPEAVLIPYKDFGAYQAWQAQQSRRAVWLAELQAIADEVSARAALSDDQALDLIDEAVRETRQRPRSATS
jgi:prevent-host-death family protein